MTNPVNVWETEVLGESFEIGSDKWFKWLSDRSKFVAKFNGIRFTCYKQGCYWYATKKVNKIMRRMYLGKNPTYNNLTIAARWLSVSATAYEQRPQKSPDKTPLKYAEAYRQKFM